MSHCSAVHWGFRFYHLNPKLNLLKNVLHFFEVHRPCDYFLIEKFPIFFHKVTVTKKKWPPTARPCRIHSTLESVIDVGQGISVGPGRVGKKNKRRVLNKHRAWKIWKKRITVGQEKIDKKNKFDQKKFANLCVKKNHT